MPGPVVSSPTGLSFLALGSAFAQNVTLSQTNNAGGYSISGCASLAATPATTAGTFAVTPLSAGTCTITATGSGGRSATIGVVVTTTGIIVH